MGLISTKLRNSARDQQCTFAIPWFCNGDTETTVLCHLPSEVSGVGTKSDDFHAAFGCSSCHDAIDQHKMSKEDELFYSIRALQRTMQIWVAKGLIFVAGIDPDKPKTRPKKKANMPSQPMRSRPPEWPKREMQSRNNLRRST